MTGFVDADFVELRDDGSDPPDRFRWPPAVVRAKQVAGEVDRLASTRRDDADLRRTAVVHPRARHQGRGLAPGIRVSVEVLLPGERALPPQTNASSLAFCISGAATTHVDGQAFDVGPRDVWSIPPMAAQSLDSVADADAVREPLVLLRFSNAALLELLGVHWSRPIGESDPANPGGVRLRSGADDPVTRRRERPEGPPGTIAGNDRVASLGPDGPWRLHYERLINPPWVGVQPWHWPWSAVQGELDAMAALDERYHGRRVCLLHDPATGRTNGTTFNLFASMCLRPANIVDNPHRHIAAAVNYFFEGEGWSTIGDERVEWAAGDLMLAAPGWTSHHHASGDAPVYQLAVQDNPLHLAMGSLLWQESLQDEPKLLGTEPGYTTNRHELDPTDS